MIKITTLLMLALFASGPLFSFSGEDLSKVIFYSKDPLKSKEIVKNLKLSPIKSITIKNATYHFTKLFKYDSTIPSDGRSRYGVFAFIEINNHIYFRFFYKSGSHGIFRVAPFVSYYSGMNFYNELATSVHWYSKGIGEGALALPPKIQMYLAQEISGGSFRKDITLLHIVDLIASFNQNIPALPGEDVEDHMNRSSKLFEDFKLQQDSIMALEVSFVENLINPPVLEEKSFVYKGETRTRLFAVPNTIILKDINNGPDYKKGAVEKASYLIEHYGEVEGSVFLSSNKSLSYYFLRNKEGKIWIPSLSLLEGDEAISSYGVPKRSVDYDDNYFLIPLWERSKYIHPDYRSKQEIPREEKYQSSWVYLKNIDLIKSFYLDQGLQIPNDID